MAKVDFQGATTAEVKVRGVATTVPPSVGMPSGPQSFPPPPPPPVVPLNVVAASTVTSEYGLPGYKITFDGPPVVTAVPNWIAHNAVQSFLAVVVAAGEPNAVYVLEGIEEATGFTVPVGATGITSASGGVVTPGTFEFPFPP